MKQPSDIFLANQDLLEEYLATWGMYDKYAMMLASAQAGREKILIKTANEAWWKLPDHSKIRGEGFFVLCDIAEHVFDD